MTRWLKSYERIRTDPDSEFRIPANWHSTRYPLEDMDWDSIREIDIPQLGMNWGKCCESIRKTWYAYKRSKAEGETRSDLAYRINRIQYYLGIPLTEFDSLDTDWVRHQLETEEESGEGELSAEEIDLRREEDDDWGIGEDEYMTAEERQLRREEEEEGS